MANKKKTVKKEEVSIEEAESKTGVKESVVNDDAVALAEETETEEMEMAMPSFFIEEEDEVVIEIDILFDKKSGRLTSVSRSGLISVDSFKTMGSCTETFTFKPIDYDQMTKYRQRCTNYRIDAQRALVDPIALRNYFIVWHLKDCSVRDNKGKKLELEFLDTGALSSDSIGKVYNLNPTLLDVVLTLFEKDMLME